MKDKRTNNDYKWFEIVSWLWRVSRGNRLQAVLNAVLGLLGVAVSLGSVWAVQRAIDIAAGSRSGDLYMAVSVMAGLILCDFAVNIGRVWIKNILGVRAQNRMQPKMLDGLIRAEWSGRERFHSGDVINRLEQDVGAVVVFVTETIPNAISVLAMFAGA